MKKELDQLTSQMISEMNGMKKESSQSENQINCPFLCENVNDNLLEHLNDEHSDKLCFLCSECNEPIIGGLRQFIFHQIMHHPKMSPSHILKSVLRYDLMVSPKKKRKPDFDAICPYCKVPVHLPTDHALKSHLESLHEDILELNVCSIISSVKLTLGDQFSEVAKAEEPEINYKGKKQKTPYNAPAFDPGDNESQIEKSFQENDEDYNLEGKLNFLKYFS